MGGFERKGVRQYNGSEVPRMRWTEELHRQFVEAVECLGSQDRESRDYSFLKTLVHVVRQGFVVGGVHRAKEKENT
ncbi:hypothetical protein C2845_PM14G07400 [Panicum miliaceum]|uniref:Uncharacterized protein n=1 Tax=Panicum miliaceum TaxID=4540 RepID=A0A3L6PLI5_PANMI|nr:hypothetical protein C2845_PM14G07400 [Panicum miliaceum]